MKTAIVTLALLLTVGCKSKDKAPEYVPPAPVATPSPDPAPTPSPTPVVEVPNEAGCDYGWMDFSPVTPEPMRPVKPTTGCTKETNGKFHIPGNTTGWQCGCK